MITMVLSLLTVLAHLDSYTRLQVRSNSLECHSHRPLAISFVNCARFHEIQKYWIKAFGAKSHIELVYILFLVLWWTIATWIQTGVRGIAGDGKGQYNLYFSTWACCWTSIWTLERWVVADGLSSFSSFMSSWPNRAPGWIAIFFFACCTLLCYLDLFLHYQDAIENQALQDQFNQVGKSQWQWLLFLAAFTIPCGAGFVLVEIFRKNNTHGDQPGKSAWETILEGVILLILALAWIPSVIVATTAGGIASLVGNSYFFTWFETISVLETSVWWVHDKRMNTARLLKQQEDEYHKIQQQVLAKSQEEAYGNDDRDETRAEGNDDRTEPAEKTEDALTYLEIPDVVGT